MPPLIVSQGCLYLKPWDHVTRQWLRTPAAGNNSNLHTVLSPPKVFQPQNPNHSSHISSRIGPEHCLLVNKCGACLDRRSAHTGLWIKHVALIKNNLAQKCQRPLRSITPPLRSIPSLQLRGFKERGPWLALATSTECIHILYDPVVNVLSGIK